MAVCILNFVRARFSSISVYGGRVGWRDIKRALMICPAIHIWIYEAHAFGTMCAHRSDAQTHGLSLPIALNMPPIHYSDEPLPLQQHVWATWSLGYSAVDTYTSSCRSVIVSPHTAHPALCLPLDQTASTVSCSPPTPGRCANSLQRKCASFDITACGRDAQKR